jgi:hypothetical protein
MLQVLKDFCKIHKGSGSRKEYSIILTRKKIKILNIKIQQIEKQIPIGLDFLLSSPSCGNKTATFFANYLQNRATFSP